MVFFLIFKMHEKLKISLKITRQTNAVYTYYCAQNSIVMPPTTVKDKNVFNVSFRVKMDRNFINSVY